MTPRLTLRQSKILVECALSKKGYAANRASFTKEVDDDWQRLMNLGYVRKLPKRGLDDYQERFVATDVGVLRLVDPDAASVAEVMDS